MPIARVEIREGKSPEHKKAILAVVQQEPPLEDWGISGGKPAGKADIGFDIHV